MRKLIALTVLLLCAITGQAQPFRFMTLDADGNLLVPTNFFTVNSNLLNAAVGAASAENVVGINEGFATNLTLVGNITNLSAVASRAAVFDSEQRLSSSDVTTVELGHLSGVTGGLQTNITARLAQTNGTVYALTMRSNVMIIYTNAPATTPAMGVVQIQRDDLGLSTNDLSPRLYGLTMEGANSWIALVGDGNTGLASTGIEFIEKDGDTGMTNKWSIGKINRIPGNTGALIFSYGTNSSFDINLVTNRVEIGRNASLNVIGTAPFFNLTKNNNDTDEKTFTWLPDSAGTLYLRFQGDSGQASNVLSFTRTGVVPDQIRVHTIADTTGTNDGALVVQGGLGLWGGIQAGGAITADSFSGDISASDITSGTLSNDRLSGVLLDGDIGTTVQAWDTHLDELASQSTISRFKAQDSTYAIHDLGTISGNVTLPWNTNSYQAVLDGDTTITWSGSAPTSGDGATRVFWATQGGSGGHTFTNGTESVDIRTGAGEVTRIGFSTKDAGSNVIAESNYAPSASGAPTDAQYWVGAADGTLSAEIVVNDSAGLRAALSDETGTGAAVFAGGNIGAATATTPTAGSDSTSVATTAFVQDARHLALAVADLSDTSTPSVLTAEETTNKLISNYKVTGADHVFTMPAAHVAGNVTFVIGDEFQVDIEPNSGDLFYLNGTAMSVDEHIVNSADTLGDTIVGFVANINGTLRWMFRSADANWVEATP